MSAANHLINPLPLTRDRHELLRKLAHELLRTSLKNHVNIDTMSVEELVHELSVHQVELELQNQELHEARLAMEESKHFLHDLFALAPVAYLVLEEGAVIREANNLACDCFSLPKNVLIGQRLSQFVRPECLYEFRELFDTPWDQRIPVRRDVTFRSHNGREFLGRLEVRRRTVLRDAALAAPQWLCAIQDVTEDKRTREALLQAKQTLALAVEERTNELERALGELHKEIEHRKTAYRDMARSKAHYEALFHNNAVGIALVSESGILLDLNHTMGRLLGCDPSLLHGKPLLPVLGCPALTLQMLLQESPLSIELDRDPSAAGVKSVALSCRRIDPCRKDAGVVLVLHDISEQKGLERLKQEVERILFHDLRGPIASIHSFSSLLATAPDIAPVDLHEIWCTISSTSKRALDLINSSTDLYHIERGDFRFAPQPTALLPIIEALREELRSMFPSKRVEVVEKHGLPAPGPRLSCMPHLFSTMLFNLMQNALEASPPQGVVRVQVVQSSSGIVIAIHNAGAVPREIRDRFFEKYVTFGKNGGTGLGTYSARRIAEAHGGSIDMTTSETDGTTVWLRFPG
ncbi:sensor histidine kinase [Megalodesulfovibrio paquesii]